MYVISNLGVWGVWVCGCGTNQLLHSFTHTRSLIEKTNKRDKFIVSQLFHTYPCTCHRGPTPMAARPLFWWCEEGNEGAKREQRMS